MPDFPFRKAHVIGIGGVGMSATAILLRDRGLVVTGSDEAVYPPISNVLAAEGLAYATPYAATNIPDDADLIVIGRNAKLVRATNAEVRAAEDSGRTILSFAETLGLLSRDATTVVAAGSFGKTTSVSLLAHALREAGADPSFMIGAAPLSPPTAAHLGQSRLFLLEGDEYPSSNSDDRSKFLHYHPDHVLLTPLAHDHVNVFPTEDAYLAPFHELVGLLPREGRMVAALSGPLSQRFLAHVDRPVVTYGLGNGDWQARDIVLGERSTFTLTEQGREIVRVETGQLGTHNIENMIGVGAFLIGGGHLSADAFAAAMASFKGIRRRLDRKSDRTRIPIFEGFGSSYDKALSAIAAMRRHFPERRLVVVFEPHTFSWRNRATLHWYDDVFDGVAQTFLWQPAAQGAGTHDQVSQAEIVARIAKAGRSVQAIGGADALQTIAAAIDDRAAVLMLTSGDLGGLIESLPAWAEDRFPA